MVELVLAANDDSGGDGGFFGSGMLIVLFILYWVPTVIALIRSVPNKGSVIVINFFLGWTFIGWIVALAMSVRSKPPVIAYPAPYPPQGGQYSGGYQQGGYPPPPQPPSPSV